VLCPEYAPSRVCPNLTVSLYLYRIISERRFFYLMISSNKKKETRQTGSDASDSVLSMLAVGKQLWDREPGDRFVERLRSEEAPAVLPVEEDQLDIPGRGLEDSVWGRIKAHEGEEFWTARRLPFKYLVEGSGIWFFREGRRINRKLTRTQVSTAIARCPLSSTTEIKDLMDYAYLFALLMDARIRGEAW
jgi:hypothetical protein